MRKIVIAVFAILLLTSCGSTASVKKDELSSGKKQIKASAQEQTAASGPEWYAKLGDYPFDLKIADVTGDGLLDLIIMQHGDSVMQVYKNTGKQSFELTQSIKSVGHHPNELQLLDRDGDHVADTIVAACEGIREMQVYKRNPDGSFVLALKHPMGEPVFSIDLGDLDGDGEIDAIMGVGPGIVPGKVIIAYSVLTDKIEKQVLKTHSRRTLFPRMGDVNGDGKLDIVVMNSDKSLLSIFINRGKREYTQKTLRTPAGVCQEMSLADLDWDGDLDYLLPFEVGKRALIIYNNGKGGKDREEELEAPKFGYAFGNAYVDASKIILGLGDQGIVAFALKERGKDQWVVKQIPANGRTWKFRFQDLDKDGKLDVVFLERHGGVRVIYDVMRLFAQ